MLKECEHHFPYSKWLFPTIAHTKSLRRSSNSYFQIPNQKIFELNYFIFPCTVPVALATVIIIMIFIIFLLVPELLNWNFFYILIHIWSIIADTQQALSFCYS